MISCIANAQTNDLGAAQILQNQAASPPIAESILAGAEAASGRAFDPSFRAGALKKLASLSPDALGKIEAAGAGIGIEAYASTGLDLVFVPVTPCRIIDTRLAGSAIAAGTQRSFLVAGACGIPFGPATAVAINFVAVSPAGAGDLRVTPYGSPMPVASVINYAAISGLNIANGINVQICNPAVTSCSFDIVVQADVSATQLVADVYGYYELLPPAGRATALVLRSFGGAFDSARTRNFVSVSHPNTGFYCLTPVSSIDPATSPAYVSVNWDNSAGNSLAAFHSNFGCPVGTFGVRTYDFSGAPSDLVSFEVFIP